MIPSEEQNEQKIASDKVQVRGVKVDLTQTTDNEDKNTLQNPLNGRPIEIDDAKRLTHHSIWIEGIEVFFPFKPYSIQEDYMRSVIKALNNNSNALLQSPTGTGKTLSLLCAALGWLRNHRMNSKNSTNRILFCSRTHAQLKQVVKELKCTAYKAKVCIMASRDQYCLKKEFTHLKDLELNGACKKSIKDKSCQFYNYNGTDKRQVPKIFDEVMDIEDLQVKGSAASSSSCGKFCPYYYSREIKDEADVVVLPYSFLLQQNRFAEFQVILKDSIIIFDEAHNVPAQAEEGTSYKVDQNLINESRKELDYLQAHLAPSMRTKLNDISDVQQLVTAFGNLLRYFEKSATLERQRDGSIGKLSPVSYFFEMIEQIAGQLVTNKPQRSRGKGLVEKNKWVSQVDGQRKFDYKAMISDLKSQKEKKESQNLQGGQKTLFSFCFKKTTVATANPPDSISPSTSEFMFQEKTQEAEIEPEETGSQKTISLAKLGEMCKKMSIIIADMQTMKCQNIDFFAGFVSGVCNMYEQDAAFNRGDVSSKVSDFYRFYFHKATNHNEQSSMNLWCLDPSLAFQNILKQHPHSIILTSGTLHPMNSWEAELKIPFEVKITTTHVINPKQSVVGSIVKTGPTGTLLNFSYNNRQSGQNANQTYDELGELLIDLSKKVPNGILVCFSSGSVMKLTQDAWVQSPNRIYSRLSELKELYFEPKNNIELTQVMKSYCAKANDDSQGAILFCVCRGKISEGIDFTDKLARAVLVVGVPFPPSADTWVITKQEYLGTTAARNAKNQTGLKYISGREWYFLCTVRAMNQALGRVIRHKDDFGGVFLCDSRFSQPQFDEHISGWVKEALTSYNSYPLLLNSIDKFFTERKQKLTSLDYMLTIGSKKLVNPQKKTQIIEFESESQIKSLQGQKRLPSEISYSTKVSNSTPQAAHSFAEIFAENQKKSEENCLFKQESPVEIGGQAISWSHLVSALPTSTNSSIEGSRHSSGTVSRPVMIPKRKININQQLINKNNNHQEEQFIFKETKNNSSFDSCNHSFSFEGSQEDFDRPALKLKQSVSRECGLGETIIPKPPPSSSIKIFVETVANISNSNKLYQNSSENSKSINFLSDVFREYASRSPTSSSDDEMNDMVQRRHKSLKISNESTPDSQSISLLSTTRNSAPAQQLVPMKNFDKAMLSNTKMGLASFKEGDVKQIGFKNEPQIVSEIPGSIKEQKIEQNLITERQSSKKPQQENDDLIPDDGTSCPICYEIPKNNHVNSTCGHKACLACWQKWLSEQLTCPLCRVRCRLPYLDPCE